MRNLHILLFGVCGGLFLANAVASPPSRTAGTSSDVFEEVAKLFQGGKDRVDLDRVKVLLTECADASQRSPFGEGRDQDFFKVADEFVTYIDGHRLEADDIVALREWLVKSLKCRDDDPKGLVKDLGNRISWALLRIFASVSHGDGAYEPRHAILCDVLSQPGISLPCLSAQVLVNHRKAIGERVREDYEFGEIDAFLVAPSSESLWNALLPACEALDRSRTGNEHFIASDLVDAMIANKDNATAFDRNLTEFVRISEKLMLAYPNFAMRERFRGVCRLGVVWDVVHAYGDDRAKATYRKYIERVRDDFMKRADHVTVMWLDQIMEKTEKPPEKYVVHLRLGEPEETAEKKDQK